MQHAGVYTTALLTHSSGDAQQQHSMPAAEGPSSSALSGTQQVPRLEPLDWLLNLLATPAGTPNPHTAAYALTHTNFDLLATSTVFTADATGLGAAISICCVTIASTCENSVGVSLQADSR